MFATPSLASAVELWHCVGWRCEEGGRGGGTNLGSCVGDIKHGCVQEAAPPVSLRCIRSPHMVGCLHAGKLEIGDFFRGPRCGHTRQLKMLKIFLNTTNAYIVAWDGESTLQCNQPYAKDFEASSTYT
jgi:hypothetical protein